MYKFLSGYRFWSPCACRAFFWVGGSPVNISATIFTPKMNNVFMLAIFFRRALLGANGVGRACYIIHRAGGMDEYLWCSYKV
jgi:hypothetical protein